MPVMAERHFFRPSEPLQQNSKRFKQKWSNHELATGVADKDDAILQKATFLTVIGDEALDVYNTFTWDSEEDKVKIDKVLEQFEKF